MSEIIPDVNIHFRSGSFPDNSSGKLEIIPSSELIPSGHLLLSKNEKDNSPATILESSEYTEVSTDGTELFSRSYGYPRITFTTEKDKSTAGVSLTPLVQVAKDAMEAHLNLFPPLSGEDDPDIGILQKALSQQGIVYGIDHQALDALLVKLKKSAQPQLQQLIARGKRPNHGKDAFIRFEVEIGPLPGKLFADGTIDFRERLMFVGVNKGELLACKVPATMGKPGTSLAGELVEATNGKDISVKVSEDTCYCEEDGTIRATASGVLSVVNDDTIRVSSKQKIDSDINFHTGNIRSQNCVEISGTVHPGFIVSAKGNVAIGGSIQSASINSHGNIVIKGGIVGKKSQIRVQGDADIHHIENGLLAAGGNVVIRSGAYYSSIQVGGNLHCPENVKIIGGDIVASGSLCCGQIGSSSAEPLSIAVGIDPYRYRQYQDLHKEYQILLGETQEWYTRHGRIKQVSKVVLAQESSLVEIEKELSRLNLIPGSPANSLGDRNNFYTLASITVHDYITAGTIVRIGNDTMTVERDMKSCILKMHSTSGAIIVDPL
ncbi:MAG: DUF342 domain-containing protein [Desulfobulbaceae bacterium]|nr:DUF342 domain-containing protein [Desulfobulbaceae bacterium]